MASVQGSSGLVLTSYVGLSVHIQPEPEAGESSRAVEDILPGSCATHAAPQGEEQLQTGGPDVSSDEDAGETDPHTPLSSGELFDGPTAVCLPVFLHRSLSHLETPGSTVRIMFYDFSVLSTPSSPHC